MSFYIKLVNIIVGVIYRHKAFLMERNQIVDPVYLVQWEIRVNAMGIWSTRNEPPSADTAFKLVAVEGISPVHDKFKFEYRDFMSVYCSPWVFNKILQKP